MNQKSGQPKAEKSLKPPAKSTLRRIIREFIHDECTDLAAGLTYYAVLSLFPAAIALTSILGFVGKNDEAIDSLFDIMRDIGAGDIVSTIQPTLETISQSRGVGLALVLAIIVGLWTASNYVVAFGRAVNRINGIPEGRPVWKLRPAMLLLTLVQILLIAAVLLALVLSGPLLQVIGTKLGIGPAALWVWRIGKWPVLAAVVILTVALLYWGAPNVRWPKFRWLSLGSFVAIVIWAVASAGFGFYVANFASYNKTYGALAGAIIFLVWLWLTNLALLFGAEVDVEMERRRELAAGEPAEKRLQLEPKDERGIEKQHEQKIEEIQDARELRRQHEEDEE